MKAWLTLSIAMLLFTISVIPLPNVTAQILLYGTWGGTEDDVGYGVAVDSSGNYYVMGWTYSFGAGKYDVFLLKFDPEGLLLWQETWGGTEHEYGSDVAVDSEGNVYVTGFTYSFIAGMSDLFVLKFDSSGALLWQKTWGKAGNDIGYGVAVDSEGNIYVTGEMYSIGPGYSDVLLLKLDSSGTLLWQKTWGGDKTDWGVDVAVDSWGDVYVTGRTMSFGAGAYDVFVLKFDPEGQLLWQETWGGTQDDWGSDVAVGPAGNVYVTGSTASFGAGGSDVLVFKLDSSGGMLWQWTWGGPTDEFGSGVAVGWYQVYVVGRTTSFGAGGMDAFVLQFHTSGTLLWQKTWGGDKDDFGVSVVAGSSSAWIVGGVGGAPPYSDTSVDGFLGEPNVSVDVPSYSLGTPSFDLSSPSGTVETPSGSNSYAGGVEAFLIEAIPPPPPTSTTTTAPSTTTTRTATSTTTTTASTTTTVPVASFASATVVLVVMSLSAAATLRRRR